ncbi:hypothetical protein MSAN_01779400 [Mycena sanguinolenta]|uniref:Transmembrane protein n=1 Tax=Mycena sanguinolenta TaxID=230812 RepID=A0A8H6XU99_9AGAR|nr:hypothetical protein MSAN_01779400 [Mycena sanguinolenta]
MGAQNSRVSVSCLLAGSWLNTVLFTLELVYCVIYMRRWKLSCLFYYGFVLFLVNDSLGTLCVYANLFLTVVEMVQEPLWPIDALLISTGLSALIEQTFLVHRYWMVTKNTIWSAFIMLLVVAHISLAIAAVALGGPYKDFAIHKGLTIVRLSLTCSNNMHGCGRPDRTEHGLVFDWIWTHLGVHEIVRRLPFLFDEGAIDARALVSSLVRSVCINALATGAIVATVTVLAMITLLVRPLNPNIFGLFFVIMGRVYSLTILVNFYQRHKQQLYASGSQEVSGVSCPQFVTEPATTRDTMEVRTTSGRITRRSASPKEELSTAPPRPSCIPSLRVYASKSEAESDTTHSRFGA